MVYDSCTSIDFTDHRPVISYFTIQIDDNKKSNQKLTGFNEYLIGSYLAINNKQKEEIRLRHDSRIILDSDDENESVADEFNETRESAKENYVSEEAKQS